MEIRELNEQISEIDRRIVELYCRRMEAAREVGRFKREHRIPIPDPEQERKQLNAAAELAGEEYEQGVRALYHLLLDHSLLRQQLDSIGQAVQAAQKALEELVKLISA